MRRARVGDPLQEVLKFLPEGFAPVFPGWNVWEVWQKDDLDLEPLMVGVSRDRRLRIWVEDVLDDAAGTAVADPLNPAALRGAQVEIIPATGKLEVAATKESVPGPALLLDSPATLRVVRFYNRGDFGVLAWPHDGNYLLDRVFVPSTDNPVTAAPAPSSLGGAATEVVEGAKKTVSAVAWVAAGAAAVALVIVLARGSK